VQNAGHACRVKAQTLKNEFHRGSALTRSLLLFGSALIIQMEQTAACAAWGCSLSAQSEWL
jgi:hypothetical protein